MSLTLLQIIQDACDRISLPRPTSVFTSSDMAIRDLFGLAQQEGKELARRGAWRKLTTEKTFTTTAGSVQTGAIPSDFDWYIPETMFNRTRRREVAGPLSQKEWQRVKSSLVTFVNPAFRFRGADILMTPDPGANETVAYEYVSLNWCQSAGGTPQERWLADGDTCTLDCELQCLGIVWRWKKSNGLDYAEDFRTYEMQVMKALMRDGASPRLSADTSQIDRTPHPPLIPDTLVFN